MAKNKGGRPKGRASYRTDRVRNAIGKLIEDDFTLDEMKRLIKAIEIESGPKDAFNAYLQMADFVLPKLQRIEHTGKDGDNLSVEHILKGLNNTEIGKQSLPEPDNSDIIEANYETIMKDNA